MAWRALPGLFCRHSSVLGNRLDELKSPLRDLFAAPVGNWGIENRLHCVRDVTFGEDGCRMRSGDGPKNMASLHNAGIPALRFKDVKGIASTLRDFATRPWDLLRFLRSV